MTPDLLDLGRRAVACPRWRWMPGMRWVAPVRPGGYGPAGNCGYVGDDGVPPPDAEAVPDFAHAGTRGCLLALVREAWGSPFARVSPLEHSALPGGVKWVFGVGTMQPGIEAPTEPAALVAALEAAP